MKQLNVYINDSKAGVLTELIPGRSYTFEYSPMYLLPDNPPVSVTMPKRETPYSSNRLFPVFTNMLPEGANRRAICRSLRIDENDYFGILEAMADKDIIGAVQLKKITNERD